MRQANFLALPLLTLTLSAFAQQGVSAAKLERLPADAEPVIRAEPLPPAHPDRLVLNRSKQEFRIWHAQRKAEEAAAASAAASAPTPTPLTQTPTGMPMPAATVGTVYSNGSGAIALTQPGLPAGIKPVPLAPSTAASAAPATQPVPPVDVTPPAPVPRTMAQAAAGMPKASDAEPADSPAPPAPVVHAEEEHPPRLIDRLKDFYKTNRREALMGAGAAVLLVLLALRMLLRRRPADDSDE